MTRVDAAGVCYSDLDEFKVRASRAAMRTAGFTLHRRWKELEWTRGESAYAMQNTVSDLVIAAAIEGLGTKNLIAENPKLRTKFERTFYDAIAQDNVAMILNDLVTIGALPLIFMLHPALAEGDHLSGDNGSNLIEGTYKALEQCRCTWGPGETPELNGIIMPRTMCLSGAVVGTVDSPKHLINPENIQPGQRIVLLGSSGIHANGLSRARKIAKHLFKEYLTEMPSGQTFGEALLTPTTLYVRFMEMCQDRTIPIAYAINMTGHGWRKLMRAVQPFTYYVERIPTPHEVFVYMQEQGDISTEDAYKAFNMGAGFALIVDAAYVPLLKEIGAQLNISVEDAGEVRQGPRQVIIEPLGLTFNELSIR